MGHSVCCLSPSTSSAPFTFAPSSSAGGVTLDAIMTQLQRMNACLDTLTTELYQVNTRVGRIARWQAHHIVSEVLRIPRVEHPN